MKKFLGLNKVSYLFSILCLSLLALMAFQITWLSMSKRLNEELFDQKVNLAIGGALTDFNNKDNDKVLFPLPEEKDLDFGSTLDFLPTKKSTLSLFDQKELENNLSTYMSCYGITEQYNIDFVGKNCQARSGTYYCAINTSQGCENAYMLEVSFASREKYLQDKMSPMIFSSILIFILLASVSFIILWALVKQKRITENNIDFFNNTAHELKTPLTNISLALKLLGLKHANIKEDKYAQIIKAENSKLSDQIERVLFLAKMENGEYNLKKEELDIKEMLGEVVENMSLLANERGGSIQLDMPDETPKILGDYFHLSNVFRNLIDNALKYCDKDPMIRITITEDTHHVKVRFADNGIGISTQDQHHIFEKFQRVNTGNIRRAKGFGIGLSYVKTVIEMHKGLVNVKSEINKGSEFQLLIPNV